MIRSRLCWRVWRADLCPSTLGGGAAGASRRPSQPRLPKLTQCDTRCYSRDPSGFARWRLVSAGPLKLEHSGWAAAALAAVALLVLPAVAARAPGHRGQGRAPEHPRRDDRRHGGERRRADAERQAAAGGAGHDASPTRSTPSRSAAPLARPSSPASTPTTTASVGNFHPYGWYGMKGRGNTLPAWLQRSGYTHRPDRQVAQRLRRASTRTARSRRASTSGAGCSMSPPTTTTTS